MKRKVLLSPTEEADVLMVPWFPQHESDSYCFPASLKMCLDYFKNYYQSQVINENLENKTYQEVIDLCGSNRFTGTKINQDLINRLSNELKLIKFSLDENNTFNDLKKRLDKNLPTILVYDGRYITYDVRGPAHAGVFIGFTKSGDPILNNPWYGSIKIFKKDNFITAWELYKYMTVNLDPEPQKRLGD